MNETKKRLLLVDASSYLYRAFHALPEFRSPSGEPTGAIRGVISMLAKLKQDFPSDYIACVFDPRGKTFRDEIYPEYKATRQAMPEDLAKQVELSRIARRNAELEIQRMTDMIVKRAGDSSLTRPPIIQMPPPAPAKKA